MIDTRNQRLQVSLFRAFDLSLEQKPSNVSWESAACLATSGMTALQALRLGQPVVNGERILINGASGGVGSFALQIAHHMGAHVTGVCSAKNVELVRSLIGCMMRQQESRVGDLLVLSDCVQRQANWFEDWLVGRLR